MARINNLEVRTRYRMISLRPVLTTNVIPKLSSVDGVEHYLRYMICAS
jgi:hypothetical protein